jgi:hypothetical protein
MKKESNKLKEYPKNITPALKVTSKADNNLRKDKPLEENLLLIWLNKGKCWELD